MEQSVSAGLWPPEKSFPIHAVNGSSPPEFSTIWLVPQNWVPNPVNTAKPGFSLCITVLWKRGKFLKTFQFSTIFSRLFKKSFPQLWKTESFPDVMIFMRFSDVENPYCFRFCKWVFTKITSFTHVFVFIHNFIHTEFCWKKWKSFENLDFCLKNAVLKIVDK